MWTPNMRPGDVLGLERALKVESNQGDKISLKHL